MDYEAVQALQAFTRRYVALWQEVCGHEPADADLHGVPSPCIARSDEHAVYWLPQEFTPPETLAGVERALDISLHPAAHAFFTGQYAGDMAARFDDISCVLLQVWSAQDFIRMQENLIGHLLTQKRLRLPPTLFLATTASEMTLISLSNTSGQVVLEEFGTARRRELAPSLADFLRRLQPVATPI